VKDASLAAVFVLLLGILLLYYFSGKSPNSGRPGGSCLKLLLLVFFPLALRSPCGKRAVARAPYAALFHDRVLLNLRLALLCAALFALMAAIFRRQPGDGGLCSAVRQWALNCAGRASRQLRLGSRPSWA
jgi:hypothetical protein